MNKDNLPSPREFYTRNLGVVLNRTYGDRQWAEAGLCPFHDDHKAGNFGVNMESGGFNCFACEAKGGSIIDFVMRRYGLDFKEAMSRLENGLY